MKFREITRRLTGISTPIFGISWNPPESDLTVARRVIRYLEDRRVLYVPHELELPEHCVHSVLEIRQHLTHELGPLQDGPLSQALSAMRAACRKFLDAVQGDDSRIIQHGFDRGHYASWTFLSAIGELRGVFGIHIAAIASAHGLDVEKQLAAIIPAALRPVFAALARLPPRLLLLCGLTTRSSRPRHRYAVQIFGAAVSWAPGWQVRGGSPQALGATQ